MVTSASIHPAVLLGIVELLRKIDKLSLMDGWVAPVTPLYEVAIPSRGGSVAEWLGRRT